MIFKDIQSYSKGLKLGCGAESKAIKIRSKQARSWIITKVKALQTYCYCNKPCFDKAPINAKAFKGATLHFRTCHTNALTITSFNF